jgi:hypothetical protein
MARDITITFADGTTHVYAKTPDSVTPEMVQSRAHKDFGKPVAGIDGGKKTEAPQAKTSLVDDLKQGAGDLAAGAVRGAGSIGATLLTPIDAAARALGVQNDYIGRKDRRESMDGALQSLGADTNSMAFKTGKIGTEIAGTAGAGGAVANVLAKIPGLAASAPSVINAIRTSGMTSGRQVAPGALNLLQDLAIRGAGGAISGAATAGLVDPNEAGTGAVIGAAAPAVLKTMGALGEVAGRVVRGPAQSAETQASIKAAREAGYVIPPSQAKPTLANRVLEGVSGKISTAQNASAKNAEVTNSLAAKALGLAPDAKITPEVVQDVRKAAGQAYEALGNSGTVTPGKTYFDALDKITAPHAQAAAGFPGSKVSPVIELVDSLKSKAFDASSAIAKIKELRSAADDAFRTGNTDIGRASKAGAAALEDAIEQHLKQSGATDLLQNFRDARQLIAKTYSVEKALNPTTGTVDARKLASMLDKGKPLSGELRQAAEFAQRFPKAAQTVEKMGSLPQTSPLDWTVAGTVGAATANPAALAGVMLRPGARALSLSDLVQNRLAKSGGANALEKLAANPELQQLIYRAAPVASGR